MQGCCIISSVMPSTTSLPKIPEDQITPLVAELLEIIRLQIEEIQLLKDEIARLKNQKPRPKIKPSRLESRSKTGKAKKKKSAAKDLEPKRWKFMKWFPSNQITFLMAAN